MSIGFADGTSNDTTTLGVHREIVVCDVRRTPLYVARDASASLRYPETEKFWTGGEHDELRIPRCADCGEWLHPSQTVCPGCHTANLVYTVVGKGGVVVGLSVNHQPWGNGLDLPYIVAIVELDDAPAVRLTTNLVNLDVADARVGLAVRAIFEHVDDVWLPMFEPSGQPDRPGHVELPGRGPRPPASAERWSTGRPHRYRHVGGGATIVATGRLARGRSRVGRGRRRRARAVRHRRAVDLSGRARDGNVGRRYPDPSKSRCASGRRGSTEAWRSRVRVAQYRGDAGRVRRTVPPRAVRPHGVGSVVRRLVEDRSGPTHGRWARVGRSAMAGSVRRGLGRDVHRHDRGAVPRPFRRRPRSARADRGERAPGAAQSRRGLSRSDVDGRLLRRPHGEHAVRSLRLRRSVRRRGRDRRLRGRHRRRHSPRWCPRSTVGTQITERVSWDQGTYARAAGVRGPRRTSGVARR